MGREQTLRLVFIALLACGVLLGAGWISVSCAAPGEDNPQFLSLVSARWGLPLPIGTSTPKAIIVDHSAPPAITQMLVETRLGASTMRLLVRDYARAHGKVLFDIADIEAHDPDGTRVTSAAGYEILYPAYTDDGGHLNWEGRIRVAQAFWVLVARLNGWNW